jgi:hypothetical protein
MQDESTYGFSKADASELIQSIGGSEETYREGLVRSNATGLFRFTLNASLSTGTADADILRMDGTDTGIDDDVLDPLGIFDTLTTGDAGLCLKQGGKYYVIQAPCPS